MSVATKPSAKPFVGRWRIIEMELWDRDYIDIDGPGHITIRNGGLGEFQFGTVVATINYQIERRGVDERLEFTWEGTSEMDPASGRGWAELRANELRGRLFIHLGDDSGFTAKKEKRAI